MERREVLKYAGTGLAGLISGYGIMEYSTDKASANITSNSLNVSDASTTTQDGTIENVNVSISGEWEYDLPSGKSPHRWTVKLLVERDGKTDKIATTSAEARYLLNNGSYSVSGSITDSDLFDASDFAAVEGNTKTIDVTLTAVFTVTTEDGSRLAKDTLSDTGTVDHKHDAYNASDFGNLTGDGDLEVTA